MGNRNPILRSTAQPLLQLVKIFKFKNETTRPNVKYVKDRLTNYSPFLVLAGLEKGITYRCDQYRAVSNHFTVYSAVFCMVTPYYVGPTYKPGDPRQVCS